jgi:hypothetical protein
MLRGWYREPFQKIFRRHRFFDKAGPSSGCCWPPFSGGSDAGQNGRRNPSITADNMSLVLNFGLLLMFCAVLLGFSLRNIKRKWIV